METKIVLALGTLLLAGVLGGVTIKKFKLPAVTGYILAGLVVGPALLKFLPLEVIEELKPLNPITLGIIAFIIGGELEFKTIRKLGRSILYIGTLQLLGAVFFVSAGLIVIGEPLPLALLLGGIATATAPAATVAVIKEIRARGPLTECLLAVVALDDALGVIVFGILATVSKVLISGSQVANFSSIALAPLKEISFSLLLGFLIGIIFSFIARRTRNSNTLLAITLGCIFSTAGISELFHLSSILANMVVGTVIVNTCPRRRKIFNQLQEIEIPLFVVFFALAGASLEVHMLSQIGLAGLVYFVMRVLGKVSGSYFGGKISGANPMVTRYLGWTLMPQAGVAVGLTILAQGIYPEKSSIILNIVLSSVLITELIGPIFSKKALEKAGEANVEKKKVLDITSLPG